MNKLNKKGFTLIELLATVAIIAVLSVIVFASLNSSKRFSDSRNSRRLVDVTRILNAVHTYIVDNSGSYPPGLSNGMAERQLGTATTGANISTGGCSVTNGVALDISVSLGAYLKTIPFDPDGTSALTKYAIAIDENGVVTVKACCAQESIISKSK